MASIRHQFSVNIADDASAQAAGEVLPSHWNAGHTLSGIATQASLDAVSNAVSVVSQALSALSNQNSVEHAALSLRIDGAGGGSVTSNELSAVSNAASANAVSIANVVSNNASIADAALSLRVDAVSQAHSVLSQAVSVISNVLSNEISVRAAADNTVSNNASVNAVSIANVVSAQAASALSQALSVLSVNDAATSARVDSVWSGVSVLRSAISARSVGDVSTRGMQSIVDALSNRISATQGGTGSVTSTEVSAGDAAVSAQAASALSQAKSVLSVADAALSARVDSVAGLAGGGSVTSTELSAVSQNASVNAISIANVVSNNASINDASIWSAVSVLRSAISARSVGDVSTRGMQSIVNALSGRISNAQSIASNALSVVSNTASVNDASIWSAVSVLRSAISARSAGNVSTRGMQSIIDALSNRISAAGGGAGSVTSTELSAALAVSGRAFSAAGSATTSVKGLQGVLNQISNTFSNSFSAGSVISVDLASVKSVISVKAPWNQAKYILISNTQSTTASALTDISGFVLTVAAGDTWKVDGMMMMSQSASNTGLRIGFSVPPLSTPRMATFEVITAAQSATGPRAGGAIQVSGTSVLMSMTSTPVAGTAFPVQFHALFNVASGGTFRVQMAGVNSTAQSPTHVTGGCMICFRLK